MNIPSFILLLIILVTTGFIIYKMIGRKGACEDCKVNSCPIKSKTNDT